MADLEESQTPQSVERVAVPALDAMLGRAIPVLDQGFVRVVDYMGGDASIVQAARVSYGAGTKRVHEDRGLIRYLMRHAHTTPFEMCELKLHVRAPMDTWRQWIRHRTASVNEYSTRYSIAIDACQQTSADAWRAQSDANRQGSGAVPLDVEVGEELTKEEAHFQHSARALYERRLANGVAREQARKDLPLSTYTEAYWKVDLHNLFNFLALRMDLHAQEEIRLYATTIGHEVVAKWCPLAWAAFADYRLSKLDLSAIEVGILQHVLAGRTAEALEAATEAGWITTANDGRLRAHRERAEFEVKARKLGAPIPWGQ